MRFTSLLSVCCLLLLSFVVSTGTASPVTEKAKTFIGVTETGQNSGTEVEMFLFSVGLEKGAPWCAAFVSYCLKESGTFSPLLSRTATGFKNKETISALSVYEKRKQIPPGSVFIMQKGNSWQGHAGFIDSIFYQDGTLKFSTIEGNTSPQPGTLRQERDGDGVYARIRQIQPYNYFRIVGFTPVRYKQG